MKTTHNIIKAIIDYQLLISIASMSFTIANLSYLHQIVPVDYIIFVFCSTCIFYNFSKIKHSNLFNDSKNNVRFVLLIVLLLIGSYSWFQFQLKIQILTTILALFASLYYIPFKYINTREIPGLKSFFITFIWISLTLMIPYSLYEIKHLQESSLNVFIFNQSIFLYSTVIPFDIRDLDIDKQNHLLTIPTILGKKYSFILLITTVWIHIITIVLLHFTLATIAFTIVLDVAIVIITYISTIHKSYYLVYLIDFIIILYSLNLWL